MPKVKIEHTMTEGPAPEAVRVTVEQGPHTLRTADVAPGAPAELDVDVGDYTARAVALVPHGTPAQAAFAVPDEVRVSAA